MTPVEEGGEHNEQKTFKRTKCSTKRGKYKYLHRTVMRVENASVTVITVNNECYRNNKFPHP